MATETSTLNHRANGATAPAVANYVRDLAIVAEAATDKADYIGPRHVAALRAFADSVASKGIRDERIYTLFRIAGYQGNSHDYTPGPQQERLFGALGQTGGPTPLPDATLNELVSAAVDDLIQWASERAAGLKARENEVETLSLRIAELEGKVTEAVATREQAEADAGEAKEEASSLRQQTDHLKAMLGGEGEPDLSLGEPEDRKRDWKAVEGHTGVYEKPNAENVTVYRIGWREAGKQKWLATGTDLDEAIAERVKILSELAGAPA